MRDCISRKELQEIERSIRSKEQLGFTLIELMIVVAMVAILAAIALPAYQRYVFRTRRAEGHEMLMRVAAAQERYYTNFNQYSSVIGTGAGGLGFAAPTGCAAGDSANCYYNVSIAGLGASNQSYTLSGAPKGVQLTDKCGNLTLTDSGVKAQSGDETNGKCW